MSAAPADKEDYATRKAKWAAMKEEFLELCITGKQVHWPTLAAKYGKNYQTARNKASDEKWYREIEERRKAREEILEDKLIERTTGALEQLNQDFMTSEVAIRKRHATMARGLQVRAVARLKDVDLKDISVRDALTMLQIGIREERNAIGLSEVAEITPDTFDKQSHEFKSVVEQAGGLRKVQSLGAKLLKALQGVDLEAEDVEPKTAHDVSDGSMAALKKGGKVVIVKKGGSAAKKAGVS